MNEDFDITMRVHTLLGQYMKDADADDIIYWLDKVLKSEDGSEFVRLMQKWIAAV